MLRDVPHCKCILQCGFGGLLLCVVLLTWVYPVYCSRVSQVKETKVREFVEGRYGISDSSVNASVSEPDPSRETPTVVAEGAAAHTAKAHRTVAARQEDDAMVGAAPRPPAAAIHREASMPPGAMR